MFQYTESLCVICRIPFTETPTRPKTKMTDKGLDSLAVYSDWKGDTELQELLFSKPEVVMVHDDCRKAYTNKRRFEQASRSSSAADEKESAPTKTLRSSVTFDWKTNCFFCGKSATKDSRYRESKNTVSVETLEIKTYLLRECGNRIDPWTLEVKGRLNTCNDLVAA